MARIFLFLCPRSILIFENILIPLQNLYLNQFRSLSFKNLGLKLSIQINYQKFQIWKVLKRFTFTYPSLTSVQKSSLKYLKPLILNSKSLKSIQKSNLRPIYSDSWLWPETLRQPSGRADPFGRTSPFGPSPGSSPTSRPSRRHPPGWHCRAVHRRLPCPRLPHWDDVAPPPLPFNSFETNGD
jgi:hypothetical protein